QFSCATEARLCFAGLTPLHVPQLSFYVAGLSRQWRLSAIFRVQQLVSDRVFLSYKASLNSEWCPRSRRQAEAVFQGKDLNTDLGNQFTNANILQLRV